MTTVGIVGAGIMGSGIAQVAVEAGERVRLHDVDPAATARAHDRIRAGLDRRAERLDLDSDSTDAWVDGRIGLLEGAASLAAATHGASLVIEAAREALDVKRALFAALDTAAMPDTVLATNTSALSVAAIAEATAIPARVLGLHFFNPVPVMALVEVVLTARTDPSLAAAVEARMAAWGKTTVRSADAPGFLVNRVNRPFTIEALRMIEAGDATIDAIDAAVRAADYPMGPFELMDLVGLDVNLAAATSVWEGLGRPDRLRPSPIQARLIADGRLGRKAGAGFYAYGGSEPGSRPDPAIAVRAVDSGVGAAARGSADLSDDAIVARIEASIAAEAQRAVEAGVGSATDIETALRLGAGHPRSPFDGRALAP